MPEQPYEELYNRVLDATAIIHMPVKIFTMLIVIRHTPADMRHLSMFLLNGIVWNLCANLVFTFIHLYPMFPAQCFRADGLVSSVNNELFGHTVFISLFVCVVNCIVAVMNTFVYRYFIFHTKTKLKTASSTDLIATTLV
ncbi:hypothetical protein QR680_016298 [Steinernema hermaphroditum]|uniref:Uncharacterized protein n=1 Tax=Steinernema hermaphroditum TaxID=289476 RepID=A0AA39HAR1_9BILA|nr:hypothetical protein QR680_016298 [Steinernema hermaphroditum]